jgi:hypothetical protein
MSTHAAYCSWCLKRTKHKLIVRNAVTRNEYRCVSCDGQTFECRVLSCKNMTRGAPQELSESGWKSFKQSWSDECCSEHDGTIANFENLNIRLKKLDEYGPMFEGKKTNFARTGIIAGGMLAGAAVFGPAAFWASPKIAASLGAAKVLGAAGTGTAISSLSGAALTSASLAAIGGGTMAAGTLFVTAAGAALGAHQGGAVSNSYFGQVKHFKIDEIHSGKGPAIVVIDGFLKQKRSTGADWKKGLKAHYGRQAWYRTNWESKNLYTLGSTAAGTAGRAAFNAFVKNLAKRATKRAGNPMSWPMFAADILGNPWHTAMVKAAMTGILLADIIARLDGRKKVVLIGHSLGARVIFYTLSALSTKQSKKIKDVILLGGAIDRTNEQEWNQCANAVSGRIVNCWSKHDWILAGLYRTANAFSSEPIGLGAIQSNLSKIVNIDVSDIVTGHMDYKPNLDTILSRVREMESSNSLNILST